MSLIFSPFPFQWDQLLKERILLVGAGLFLKLWASFWKDYVAHGGEQEVTKTVYLLKHGENMTVYQHTLS